MPRGAQLFCKSPVEETAMKASHLRSFLTHVLTFLIGCGVATFAYEYHLGVRVPEPLRPGKPDDLGETSKVIASSRRFLIVEGRLGKSFGPETYYSLWDRTANEILALFDESDASKPLDSRTLFRPGKNPLSAVANVHLDEKTYQVSWIECSTGWGGREEIAESIYDTNADGIFDVLRGRGKAPDDLLLRTHQGWVTAIVEDDTRKINVDGQWVPVTRHEDGFWGPE
jgi:hypothetical protein